MKVAEAKVTEKKINEARESYRLAAARASLLYFILNDLNKINPLYQFSLKVILCNHTDVDRLALGNAQELLSSYAIDIVYNRSLLTNTYSTI